MIDSWATLPVEQAGVSAESDPLRDHNGTTWQLVSGLIWLSFYMVERSGEALAIFIYADGVLC